MATILELVTILKAELSENEQIFLAEQIDNSATEYYSENWGALSKMDLLLEKTQNNVIRTIFQLQYGNYDGIANEILSSLMSWTGGTVVFKDFPRDENEFYQRVFGLIGFQNFTDINTTKQIYLLGSRFLPLGPMLGLDVLSNVELHFTNYCEISILESEAQAFAGAIRNNQTVLFKKTIAGWVDDFLGSNVNSVDAYVKSSSVQDMLKKDSEIELLGIILDLYTELVTGVIWKNVEKSDCVHGHIEEMIKDKKSTLSADDLYLQEFAKIDKVEIWLQDAEEIGRWLQTKDMDFIKKLCKELAKKVDLNNTVQLELTSTLLGFIEESRLIKNPILLFDESTGQFEWNPDFLN